MTQNKTDPPQIWKRLPRARANPVAMTTTTALAGSSAVMLAFAVPHLIGGDFIDLIKALVIAGAGGLVAYGVNRLAVEKGAPLAAIGNPWAGLVSSTSIITVGVGLATATYAGFIIEDVRDLRLQAHGQELTELVDDRSRKAEEALRARPVISSIVGDLTAKQECERLTSCISGHHSGGDGPVARTLTEKLQHAETITAQVKDGEAVRQDSIKELNRLLAKYQDTLSDPDADQSERRKLLQETNAQIGQQISALDEAVPTMLLTAYATELQQPIEISGRRESAQKVSTILAGHGASLEAVLQSVERDNQSRPAFPGRTGVSDTFAYLGHFLPIGVIVAVVELIFPITLWLYTYFALVARVARDDPPQEDASIEPDSFAGLVAMKPVATAASPTRARRNSRQNLNGA